MIHGQVVAHHVLVPGPLRLPNQSEMAVECVVDTGFTGFLTLSPVVASALNLPFLRRISASLADGSTIFLSVYSATIIWDGAPRDVEVLATGRQPLLGTLLLEGYKFTADFEDGGTVTLTPFNLLHRPYITAPGKFEVKRHETLDHTPTVSLFP